MKSSKNKKKQPRKQSDVGAAEVIIRFYINDLKRYLIWCDKVKRSYGWKPGREFDSISLKKTHYDKLVKWNNLLRAFEWFLGLTTQQIKKIEQKIDNGEW